MSSSSLYTSRATYVFLSLPNSFQISALMEFAGAPWVRLFGGGGESLNESERCLFRKVVGGGYLDDDFCSLAQGRAGTFSEAETFFEGYIFEADPLVDSDLSTGLPLALTWTPVPLKGGG